MATLAAFRQPGVPDTQKLPPLNCLDLSSGGAMPAAYQELAPFRPRAPGTQVQVLTSLASLRALPENTIATGYLVAEHVEPAPFRGPDVPDTLVLPSLSSMRLLPMRAAQPDWLTRNAPQPHSNLPPARSVYRYYQNLRRHDRTMLRSIELRRRLMAQSPASTGTLRARPSPPQPAVANTATEQSPESTGTISIQASSQPAVSSDAAEVVVKNEDDDDHDNDERPGQATSPKAPRRQRGTRHRTPSSPRSTPPRTSRALGTFDPHMSSQSALSRRVSVPSMSVKQLERHFIPPGHIFNPMVGKIMPRTLSDDDPKRSIAKMYVWDNLDYVVKMEKLRRNPFYENGDEDLEWEQFYEAILRRFARSS